MTSLRSTLLVGLVALHVAVIGGIVAIVYAHASAEAHDALREDVRFRAQTLAGILEIDSDGPEFEASGKTMPEYVTPRSGTYAVFYDAQGKALWPSPSLGGEALAAFAPWSEGGVAFADVPHGPHGIPCLMATYSFVARVEPHDGWTPPPEAERRYQIVAARDSRPRDAALATHAAFLAWIGGSALVVTALGGIALARFVLRPIRRMTDEAARLTPQDTSRRLEPRSVVRELSSLAETLNAALDRLGDALDRQRRFTSDASHELRTPLAVLRGNADLLLRRERTPQEYRDGLERQQRIATRMTDITENLLALARADDGRAQIRKGRVEMSGVTRGVCDEFEALAREERISLACVADDSVAVDGDPTYLAGMLQNLVSNAVKFAPAGGVVRVGLSREDGHAVLDVADSGPGIPQNDRERIFERFFRVHEGRGRHEGAGLGLAIVRWIVSAHGGGIEVLDREGGGTVVRVRLPLSA